MTLKTTNRIITKSKKEAEKLLNEAYRNGDMGYMVKAPGRQYEVVIMSKVEE